MAAPAELEQIIRDELRQPVAALVRQVVVANTRQTIERLQQIIGEQQAQIDRLLETVEPRPPAPQPIQIPPPPWSEHYRPELDPDHEPASEKPKPTPKLNWVRELVAEDKRKQAQA